MSRKIHNPPPPEGMARPEPPPCPPPAPPKKIFFNENLRVIQRLDMTELDNSGFVKKGDPHPTDYKDLSSHVWALADNQRMPGTLEYTCLRCGIPYFDIEGGETVTEDSCPPPPRPRALGSRDNSSKPPISMV